MSWWTDDRISYAAIYLITNARLTPTGAAGLVTRWATVEASDGPSSVNPYSHAFGIAQWLGSRLAPIRGNTSFDAQLAHAVQELNGSESRAGNKLRSASTADAAATGASMYERAEGYNAGSGRDNFTNKTANGIPRVLAIVNRSYGTPISDITDAGAGPVDDVDTGGITYIPDVAQDATTYILGGVPLDTSVPQGLGVVVVGVLAALLGLTIVSEVV